MKCKISILAIFLALFGYGCTSMPARLGGQDRYNMRLDATHERVAFHLKQYFESSNIRYQVLGSDEKKTVFSTQISGGLKDQADWFSAQSGIEMLIELSPNEFGQTDSVFIAKSLTPLLNVDTYGPSRKIVDNLNLRIKMEDEAKEKETSGKAESAGKEKKAEAKYVISDVDTLPAITPKTQSNSYALIIGIENYRDSLPAVDYAASDAQLVSKYASDVLGFPAENIVTITNERASKSDMKKYIETWLPKNVEKDSKVLVYYSGHGAPNPTSGEAYLVPYDGDPTFISDTGYPLAELYENLEKLPTNDIIVMLDSCFSGSGNRSVIAKGARPIVAKLANNFDKNKKTTVLSASSGSQISQTYDKKGHGLFTYFMLKGLGGAADSNKDGAVELQELYNYIKPNVASTARKLYNNEQSPQLNAPVNGKKVLVEGFKNKP